MAKLKGKKTGPKPKDKRRTAVLTIKGFDEWKAWVLKLAKSNRLTPSQMVDFALTKVAELQAFEPPPER